MCVVGLESPESSSSEASSGYLQDAVAHWSDRCNKRQRMAEAAAPPRRPAAAAANEDLHCLLQVNAINTFMDNVPVIEDI